MNIIVGDLVTVLKGSRIGKVGEVISIDYYPKLTVYQVKFGGFRCGYKSSELRKVPGINYDILIDHALDMRDELWFKELHEKKQSQK